MLSKDFSDSTELLMTAENEGAAPVPAFIHVYRRGADASEPRLSIWPLDIALTDKAYSVTINGHLATNTTI